MISSPFFLEATTEYTLHIEKILNSTLFCSICSEINLWKIDKNFLCQWLCY